MMSLGIGARRGGDCVAVARAVSKRFDLLERPFGRFALWAWLYPALVLFIVGCGGGEPAVSGPPSARLVDLFGDAQVRRDDDAPAAPPQIAWSFEGAPDSAPVEDASAVSGWIAGGGVSGLAVQNQLLAGDTTDATPTMHAPIANVPEAADLVTSVEVRAKVSGGTRLAAALLTTEDVDLSLFGGPDAPLLSAPLAEEDGIQTYTLRTAETVLTRDIRHILLRPSDAAGAHFEIESVRLITLKAQLADAPAAVIWYGQTGRYMETIAATAATTALFEVKLHERPWLDLLIGTIEEAPVTFRIGLGAGGETTLLEQTVTAKDGWTAAPVDLADYAGSEVALSLHVEAADAGAIAFWGCPVLRNNGAKPVVSSSQPEAPAPPQGVILVMADSLRRDHLNAYGYERETAPALARMASQGVLFQDCVAQGTSPEASAPSILTSMYAGAHGVRDASGQLPSSAQTLAEAYREAGYATLSLSSSSATGQSANLHHGFEVLHGADSLTGDKPSKSSQEYVDRLLRWLEEHREVPFFVFLHVSDPAAPFEAKDPHGGTWADPAKRAAYDPALQQSSREELEGAGVDPDAFVACARDLYDGSILGMDAAMGRLLDGLAKLGLQDKTAVAFAGACGEEFLEHGRIGRGHSVYGELANVPLMLMAPGAIPAGKLVAATVQTIDVMPTLLEMSGLELRDTLQGSSLLPLVAADSGGSTGYPAVTESFEGAADSRAIIVDEWKLVQHAGAPGSEAKFALYNHAEDPLDQTDLAGEHPELVERLNAELEGWRERTRSAELSTDADTAPEESSAALDALQSLPYL